uniref:PPM-type phosphatase domain-containing protein n=1 Tax=Macrostomum lignano TaxID=282301 RepID=A0A1I8FIQ6_9PLAT
MLGWSSLHPVVVPDPQVTQLNLTEWDDALVLANRGLWSHVGHEVVAAEVLKVAHPVAAAKRLWTWRRSVPKLLARAPSFADEDFAASSSVFSFDSDQSEDRRDRLACGMRDRLASEVKHQELDADLAEALSGDGGSTVPDDRSTTEAASAPACPACCCGIVHASLTASDVGIDIGSEWKTKHRQRRYDGGGDSGDDSSDWSWTGRWDAGSSVGYPATLDSRGRRFPAASRLRRDAVDFELRESLNSRAPSACCYSSSPSISCEPRPPTPEPGRHRTEPKRPLQTKRQKFEESRHSARTGARARARTRMRRGERECDGRARHRSGATAIIVLVVFVVVAPEAGGSTVPSAMASDAEQRESPMKLGDAIILPLRSRRWRHVTYSLRSRSCGHVVRRGLHGATVHGRRVGRCRSRSPRSLPPMMPRFAVIASAASAAAASWRRETIDGRARSCCDAGTRASGLRRLSTLTSSLRSLRSRSLSRSRPRSLSRRPVRADDPYGRVPSVCASSLQGAPVAAGNLNFNSPAQQLGFGPSGG